MKRVSKLLNSSASFNKIEDVKNTPITKSNLINILFSFEEKDVTASFLMDIFGEFNGKSLCNPYDTLKIPIGLYHNNKNEFITTVGLWVFNKYFIDKELFKELGYVNQTITDKMFKNLNQKLSYAVIEDRVTTEELSHFLLKTQFLMQLEQLLTPNHSREMLTSSKKINKKKEELFKKYQKEIDSGDVVIAEQIEKELLNYAKELLGDDPSLDTFDSGAQGSFGNNFKNMFVMQGAIRNPDPLAEKQYSIIKSNFIDGISPEDYAAVSNSLAAGPYARACKTADGGYKEKLMISGLQHLIAGPPDSDCGSKNYVTVTLTDKNIKLWMYSYIVGNNGSLTELNSTNMDKYIGKTVKFRYSSMCKSKNYICNKCTGNLFNRLGIKNIGLTTAMIASKCKLISMKAFHDSVVTTTEMDVEKAFGLKK